MAIRIASFNLENLFTRPSAMVDGGAAGQQAIDDHAAANAIIEQPTYSAEDQAALLELDRRYRFSAINPPSKALVTLNKVRGQLFRRSRDGVVTVVEVGRGEWTSWLRQSARAFRTSWSSTAMTFVGSTWAS